MVFELLIKLTILTLTDSIFIMDPRHNLRVKIVQQLFALSFVDGKIKNKEEKTKLIIEKMPLLNDLIKKFASKYPLEKVSKVDLSILRLAVYELNFEKKTPPKVVIDEAIELAKELGSEKTFGFVNAVLGKIYGQ